MIKRFLLFTIIGMIPCIFLNAQHSSANYVSLQKRIAAGWNTWSYGSMLDHVLLPEGLSMKVNFRQAGIGTPYDPNYFMNEITVDKKGMIRPIAHSTDGAYTELIIDNWYGNSIKIQSAAMGNDMVILVTPIQYSSNVKYYVELETGFLWNRPGALNRIDETIIASTTNKQFIIRSTSAVAETYHPYSSPYLAVKGDTIIGFYTGNKKSLATIQSAIAAAKNNWDTYAKKYGDKAEAFQGIQSVLGWNTLYDAEKNRVITPVTRGWNEAWQGFVLFEWDTYFASLLFALDNKDYAYSNAIAVTQGINKLDAVGFTQMPGNRISDQSQPPVGSTVCWMIYEKYREKWFLEELYQGLLSWNLWWIKERNNQGFLTWGTPWKGLPKDAILESGLDNSPMYEGTALQQVGNNWLLNIADVGLNSLYVADCKSLAKIARALGKLNDEKELLQRASLYSEKTNELWSETDGIYLNRTLDKGEKSYRLSPTLFYPMMAGIPSKSAADRMIKEHLHNPKEFYGEYIIPSCAFNDKSFDNDYWRGSIWGPMNFLVYLGLKNYDKKAAAELAEKSFSLFDKAWKTHHYVFENINSIKGVINKEDQLNCDPYYHWGALMGLLQFIENKNF
jgi:putative isomerase